MFGARGGNSETRVTGRRFPEGLRPEPRAPSCGMPGVGRLPPAEAFRGPGGSRSAHTRGPLCDDERIDR